MGKLFTQIAFTEEVEAAMIYLSLHGFLSQHKFHESIFFSKYSPLGLPQKVRLEKIARVRNCPDLTISISLFCFCIFVFLSSLLIFLLSTDSFQFLPARAMESDHPLPPLQFPLRSPAIENLYHLRVKGRKRQPTMINCEINIIFDLQQLFLRKKIIFQIHLHPLIIFRKRFFLGKDNFSNSPSPIDNL